jgi:glycosyltransferase involved in cell wall biosynthesis
VSDDGVVVTTLAHFYVRKDNETLLAAWRQTLDQVGPTPVTLVLAGRPEGRRELLEALAERLEIERHVRFVGDVEDVAGLLAASDVGVLSSLPAEGCSNAVLEKMAFGLPVVASDIPGIRETLGSDRWPSVVPPNDPGAMGTALTRLCLDQELRVRIGSDNAMRQRALFDAERMLEETVAAILDGLAPQGPMRRRWARSCDDPSGSPE